MKKMVLLGITGSISATLHHRLFSGFTDDKYHCTIVATEAALKLSSTLNKSNCYRDQDEWDHYLRNGKVLHIDLVKQSDILLVAPATANTIAKFANGICDNLLTNIFCAWDFSKPVYIAPAMNTHMYNHPATQKNIKILSEYCTIIDPVSKRLYCGDEGIGALCETKHIIERVKNEQLSR